MFDFSLNSMQEILRKSSEQITNVLPEGMAEGIANEILKVMPPENADVAQFVSVAMNEIAQKLATVSEKISVKIPTAQELIEYTGAYPVVESDDKKGFMDLDLTGSWVKVENRKAENEKKEKEISEKLANSRYDLSDFADITYTDNNKPKQIVIAAAYKGKVLHIAIKSSDANFKKILKKCTMH